MSWLDFPLRFGIKFWNRFGITYFCNSNFYNSFSKAGQEDWDRRGEMNDSSCKSKEVSK